MPRYLPVRPASPTDDSQDELRYEEIDGQGSAGANVEQKERLLPDGDDGDNGDSEEQLAKESDASCLWMRTRSRWCLAWLLVGVIAILLLVAAGLGIKLFITAVHEGPGTAKDGQLSSWGPSASAFRRPDEDYVLDPDWDFDASPTVREYDWVISDIVANPDGVFRPMTVINGLFPGELIRCNEGDTIVVNLENRSVNATAIHWHGIFQNGSNWMDGTPGVTQCPISPGQSFRYEFTVQGQSGTYFYHGHQAAQHLDGLVGPIVVHSRQENALQQLPYASDRVVLLQDWYHDLSSGLLFASLSSGSESSPVPNGALINGRNIVDCSQHATRPCDNSTAGLPTFELAPHENHRLRVLNVGGFAWFEVTIDGHRDLSITEVDGTTIEPSPEQGLLIAPGQRYSIVMSANQQEGHDAFWFRARMMNDCFAVKTLPENGVAEARAVVRYKNALTVSSDAQEALPTTTNDSGTYSTQCRDMATTNFVPIPARDAPQYAHDSWYLQLNLQVGKWELERGYINGSAFRPDLKSPALHRALDGLASHNSSFTASGVNSQAFDTPHELVISSTGIHVVDIILQNYDPGNHPFHLHGAHLWRLAGGPGDFPGYEALGFNQGGKGLLDPHNSAILNNPIRRDVVTVEGKGWLLVRFIADNPGVWLFHCHMIWHAEAGMGMQFLSRVDIMENWTVPAANAKLCEARLEDLEKGSTPKDSIWDGSVQR